MEQLELKHLAPYSPYKVQVYGSSEIWELFGIDRVSNGEIFVNLYSAPSNYYREASMYEHSLLLRPLSDLKKEIEVNGEKFIPIDRINKESTISEYYVKHTSIGIVLLANHRPGYNVLSPLNPIYKLLEWHFDINGLIEKGLAIDINSLNETSKK